MGGRGAHHSYHRRFVHGRQTCARSGNDGLAHRTVVARGRLAAEYTAVWDPERRRAHIYRLRRPSAYALEPGACSGGDYVERSRFRSALEISLLAYADRDRWFGRARRGAAANSFAACYRGILDPLRFSLAAILARRSALGSLEPSHQRFRSGGATEGPPQTYGFSGCVGPSSVGHAAQTRIRGSASHRFSG